MIRHLFARLLPSRGRYREPATTEPPSGSHVCTRACDAKYGLNIYDQLCPDADPAPATVLLRPMFDADTGHVPAVVVHQGSDDTAATSAFYAALRADDGSLDPVEAVWEQACAEFREAGEAAARESRRRLDAELDAFAPGWRDGTCERSGCHACVRDFEEAMELAGVIVLPGRPVDWSTAEYRLVGVGA